MKILVFNECDFTQDTDSIIDGLISFDINGNTYITINDIDYQLCIDGKNNPYLDKADYSIIKQSNIDVGTIVDESMFNGNKKEDLTSIIDPDFDDNDSDAEDYDDSNFCGVVHEKYLPEENGYLFSIPTDDFMTSKFYFCQNGSHDIKINERNNGDILSLYDTFLYNGNQDNGVCIFRTKLVGEPPLYAIRIYKNIICCRNICDLGIDKKYFIKMIDNVPNILLI